MPIITLAKGNEIANGNVLPSEAPRTYETMCKLDTEIIVFLQDINDRFDEYEFCYCTQFGTYFTRLSRELYMTARYNRDGDTNYRVIYSRSDIK